MKLLLVSRPGKAKDAFVKILESYSGVEIICVAHPDDAEDILYEQSISGILFNVATLVREKDYNKRRIVELSELYPVVRLRHNVQDNTINVLHYGQSVEREDSLQQFILEECASFKARPLRQRERVRVYLHVILYKSRDFEQEIGEKACTINLSGLGSYIVTCGDYSRDQPVWMKLFDHPDVPPISCRVVWTRHWGGDSGLPGIGMVFLNLEPVQTERIEQIIKSSFSYRQK